jgi:NTE family protein
LAGQHQRDLPYLIQYFVSGLGRDAASCSDLMSYLLFTPKYTNDLIDIGYNDAGERIDEIEDFLYSTDDEGAGSGGANKSRHFGLTRRAPNLVRVRG